uniref:Uncharacterized protein n=3 Tax=Viruses TaxID=10239 RepID=A0A8S5PKK2_9CAUD|nr:MAG TPA: hypothetical protein [Siphoviridae sp. ctJcm18]DAE06700.1 MAG TPA: hypothetical protein [Siphoviridae sp. ctUGQ45]DAE27356.1 MAG TPA: hypothetical protein [virus sp. ct8MV80]DAV73406.1 MAG TPA: hypothetical protein [Bacteriophage sp.]DAW91629.1 MAG TPA: hypothetical protein [Bacteriophage sp.]
MNPKSNNTFLSFVREKLGFKSASFLNFLLYFSR